MVVCENCDWQFVFQEAQVYPHCPHCYKPGLVDLSQETRDQLAIYPPELILTPTLSTGQISQILQSFSSGLWFSPPDLKVANMLKRLVLFYLPIWLVDSSVQATWKAEAGFNYQVLSHQDRFDDHRGVGLLRKFKRHAFAGNPGLVSSSAFIKISRHPR